MTIERFEPAYDKPEREMLVGWLDYHRATLAWKCEGLTDEQLRERSVPPSTLSLLGLVRHMAEVERYWFRQTLHGEQADGIYYTDDDPDGDFDNVDGAVVSADFATWRNECDLARKAVDAAESLDVAGTRRGESITLRWILTHMIEEYARHNGHADLIRQRIDGQTGD